MPWFGRTKFLILIRKGWTDFTLRNYGEFGGIVPC